MSYFVTTTIARADTDRRNCDCNVLIEFEVTSFAPGYPAPSSSPLVCGAEAPELDFEILSMTADPSEPDDVSKPLTILETAIVTAWFYGRGLEQVYEAADSFIVDRTDELVAAQYEYSDSLRDI